MSSLPPSETTAPPPEEAGGQDAPDPIINRPSTTNNNTTSVTVLASSSSNALKKEPPTSLFGKTPSNPATFHHSKSDIISAREQIPLNNTNNVHAATWEQVADLVETNTVTGLSTGEAQARLVLHGKNKLAEAPAEPLWHKIFRQINSILIYILLVAAIIAGGFQEWAEFGLILGVVILNVLIGLFQEGKAERATKALKSMLSSKATVIRDGNRQEIDAEDVVLGDIVFVESGDKIPADLRLFSVSNLQIMEAMLTGESLPVNKKTVKLGEKIGLGDRKNMAFSATSCIKGQGMGIVTATGDVTEIGKINSAVSEVKQEKTQLLKQIDAFATWVGMMTIPIAVASFLLAYFSPSPDQYDVAYAFVQMVAISVAIIPEGLPALITITFAIATSYLAKNKAIVKTLPAVETLGSVMVICSDKTGTLTKNEMTVVAARTLTRVYKVNGVGYDPRSGSVTLENGEPLLEEKDAGLHELALGGVLCNEARLSENTFQPVGDPTEVALVTFAQKLTGQDADTSVRSKYARLGVIPFESEHKFMVTFHDDPSDSAQVIVYCKGAPDRLIPRCLFQLSHDGTREEMNPDVWLPEVTRLSGKGLRCLAVCRTEMKKIYLKEALEKGPLYINNAEEEPFLVMVGLAAIMDPPREECIVAIQEAKRAGITTKMITGDHHATAQAIGEALGIVDATHTMVLTGPQMDEMSPEELAEVVLECNVYARASPDNKIAIVRALQTHEQICSMTGDGVNDAPALRAADIGVAMGITGTDVSKDAAKIILTDDNFATILVAVKEGRRVWDNLRKLLVFNMPVAFSQGGVVFFSLCLQLNTIPLSAIQILYVNMITACTMGMMLAFEPAEEGVMTRPPRKATAGLIGRFFYWRTFYVAIVFIVLTLGSVAWINVLAPPRIVQVNGTDGVMNQTIYEASSGQQHSIALNTLVFCEITYAFNCRFLLESSFHPRVFFGNNIAWVCALIMIGLQLLITYVPGLNDFFSMEGGMDGTSWGICLFFAFVSFCVVELEKWVGMKKYVLPVDSKLRACFSRCCCCCTRCFPDLKEGPKPVVLLNPKLLQGAALHVGGQDTGKEAV